MIFTEVRDPEKATDLKATQDSRLKIIQLDVSSDEPLVNSFQKLDGTHNGNFYDEISKLYRSKEVFFF